MQHTTMEKDGGPRTARRLMSTLALGVALVVTAGSLEAQRHSGPLTGNLLGGGNPQGGSAGGPSGDPAQIQFELGPIDEVTTRWHPAPLVIEQPAGTVLSFRVIWDVPYQVEWIGAREFFADGTTSMANMSVDGGIHQQVQARISDLDGNLVSIQQAEVNLEGTTWGGTRVEIFGDGISLLSPQSGDGSLLQGDMLAFQLVPIPLGSGMSYDPPWRQLGPNRLVSLGGGSGGGNEGYQGSDLLEGAEPTLRALQQRGALVSSTCDDVLGLPACYEGPTGFGIHGAAKLQPMAPVGGGGSSSAASSAAGDPPGPILFVRGHASPYELRPLDDGSEVPLGSAVALFGATDLTEWTMNGLPVYLGSGFLRVLDGPGGVVISQTGRGDSIRLQVTDRPAPGQQFEISDPLPPLMVAAPGDSLTARGFGDAQTLPLQAPSATLEVLDLPATPATQVDAHPRVVYMLRSSSRVDGLYHVTATASRAGQVVGSASRVYHLRPGESVTDLVTLDPAGTLAHDGDDDDVIVVPPQAEPPTNVELHVQSLGPYAGPAGHLMP